MSPDSLQWQIGYLLRIRHREKADKDPFAESTDDDAAPDPGGSGSTGGETGGAAVADARGDGGCGTDGSAAASLAATAAIFRHIATCAF